MAFLTFLKFLRGLFWFLFPWLVLVAGAAILIPLDTHMPGVSYTGPLQPLSPKERALQANLRRHVQELAGRIGERNMHRMGALQAAAHYVETQFRAAGLEVTSETYEINNDSVRNLVATIRGRVRPHEIVIVGAHYDSILGSPGANDNASGVAALLSIARSLAAEEARPRTIRFVAFVNEEPPYFKTWGMGSRVHANRAKSREESIVAMLSLETIGYYSEEPNSQFFPYHLGLFYPWTGNFIAFVADRNSRDLLFELVAAFRRHARFQSEGLAAPAWITGVDWSDHWSFWEEGYAAVMITDTALYRYSHYHDRKDTPDKICFDCLARVTGGLIDVVKAVSE
jgi:Zn-dependent M28 family amino/carboxypeptidase